MKAYETSGVWDALNVYFDTLSDTSRDISYVNVAGLNQMTLDFRHTKTNLESINPDKAGIRTPALFIAQPGSSFAMHYELGSTMFCNEHLWGAPKVW